MTATSPSKATVANISGDSIVLLHDIKKHYRKGVDALKGVTLDVRRGDLFGLIGPDGAGKTTALKIVAGIMEATAGEISVLGKKPSHARKSIGYVPQGCALYPDLTIDENLRYEAGMRGVSESKFLDARNRYLNDMGLLQFADRLAGQLSGGMKQKLALCCALVGQPELILLDEPTTGLDAVARRELWHALSMLSHGGVTAIVATPFLDEAERCNKLALLYDGTIHDTGSPEQLKQSLKLRNLKFAIPEDIGAELVGDLTVGSDSNIFDVSILGGQIEVLCKNTQTAKEQILSVLANRKLAVERFHETDPSIENVFIARLRDLGQTERAAIPFPKLNTESKTKEPAGDNVSAIKAQQLVKNFGSFRAVNGVSIDVHYGDIYGLLGANGAGKTTTIKMLCGLLKPSSGTISLAGERGNLRSPSLRKRIGYMSQKFTLYDSLTVRENLDFYASIYEIPYHLRSRQRDWVIQSCELSQVIDSPVGRLPLGWKQRIAFGASVMHEPDIIFLDEPTAGVDPLARRQLWKLIRLFAQNGAAIVVTTHYLDEAEYCSELAFTANGRILAQGSPYELKHLPKGKLVEIAASDLQECFDRLREKCEPWRVSIFGNAIHLNVAEEEDLKKVESSLDGCKITSIRPIAFSLEDAFIDTIRRNDSVKGGDNS